MPASPFQELQKAARDRHLPPVGQWNPARVGVIDIRIAANGDWYHEGDPIRRFAIARLFATILRLDDGEYFLVTPAEKLTIRVDDAPFIATDMESGVLTPGSRLPTHRNLADFLAEYHTRKIEPRTPHQTQPPTIPLSFPTD